MVIDRVLFLSYFGEVYLSMRKEIYNLFQKFSVRDRQFSFYGPGKSDDETDTDIINIS